MEPIQPPTCSKSASDLAAQEHQRLAVVALNQAVSRGEVRRHDCVFCGDHRSQGHHEDYSKPLQVVWLCQKHHQAVHHGRHIVDGVLKPALPEGAFEIRYDPDAKRCLCGKKARANQSDCLECHAASVKQSRVRRQVELLELRRIVKNMTQDNPATREFYTQKCKGDWVIICDELGDIPGRVIGFLPGLVLRVIDDKGNLHYPTLDRVVEDVARRLYGQPTTDTKTQLFVPNPEGNQARVPAEILAQV